MKLVDIHRKFIVESSRSIIENSLPVKPVKSSDNPIMAIEKWKIDDEEFLSKKYMFESLLDRNRFVNSLLSYELELGHNAKITISGNVVVLRLKTHDVDKITELDKTYSKYADIIRKDIAYNPTYE
jgi:4a-hydroxytetrahydrobiopterin dehydratase